MPGNVVESHIRRRQKPFRLGELQLHSIGKKILTFFKTIWTDAPYLEKRFCNIGQGDIFQIMCIDIIKNITDYPTGERRAGFG